MTLPFRHKVLVFEWLYGGGLQFEGVELRTSSALLRQGIQMLDAVCTDFQAAGCDVCLTIDSRLVDSKYEINAEHEVPVFDSCRLRSTLLELAAESDFILIIAPETGGRLLRCLNWLQSSFQHRILNPDPSFTKLASDKNTMQKFLVEQDVCVPMGNRVTDFLSGDDISSITGMMVLKRADGCGGEEQRLIELPDDADQLRCDEYSDWRIEELVEGVATSVSCIAGAEETLILPALRQVFDSRKFGRFLTCADNLPEDISNRARCLAEQTLAVLPGTKGFYGIDMVIGDRDVVIEVNPRITMSWCCLRESVHGNLAARMLQLGAAFE